MGFLWEFQGIFQGDLPGISGKWWVFGTVQPDVSSMRRFLDGRGSGLGSPRRPIYAKRPRCCFTLVFMMVNNTHGIHVWYIYLHLGDFVRANVGKYTIHRAYGI